MCVTILHARGVAGHHLHHLAAGSSRVCLRGGLSQRGPRTTAVGRAPPRASASPQQPTIVEEVASLDEWWHHDCPQLPGCGSHTSPTRPSRLVECHGCYVLHGPATLTVPKGLHGCLAELGPGGWVQVMGEGQERQASPSTMQPPASLTPDGGFGRVAGEVVPAKLASGVYPLAQQSYSGTGNLVRGSSPGSSSGVSSSSSSRRDSSNEDGSRRSGSSRYGRSSSPAHSAGQRMELLGGASGPGVEHRLSPSPGHGPVITQAVLAGASVTATEQGSDPHSPAVSHVPSPEPSPYVPGSRALPQPRSTASVQSFSPSNQHEWTAQPSSSSSSSSSSLGWRSPKAAWHGQAMPAAHGGLHAGGKAAAGPGAAGKDGEAPPAAVAPAHCLLVGQHMELHGRFKLRAPACPEVEYEGGGRVSVQDGERSQARTLTSQVLGPGACVHLLGKGVVIHAGVAVLRVGELAEGDVTITLLPDATLSHPVNVQPAAWEECVVGM